MDPISHGAQQVKLISLILSVFNVKDKLIVQQWTKSIAHVKRYTYSAASSPRMISIFFYSFQLLTLIWWITCFSSFILMQMTKLQCNLWNKNIVQNCSMIIIWVSTYTIGAGYPNIIYATSSHEQIDHYAWIIVFVVYR